MAKGKSINDSKHVTKVKLSLTVTSVRLWRDTQGLIGGRCFVRSGRPTAPKLDLDLPPELLYTFTLSPRPRLHLAAFH